MKKMDRAENETGPRPSRDVKDSNGYATLNGERSLILPLCVPARMGNQVLET